MVVPAAGAAVVWNLDGLQGGAHEHAGWILEAGGNDDGANRAGHDGAGAVFDSAGAVHHSAPPGGVTHETSKRPNVKTSKRQKKRLDAFGVVFVLTFGRLDVLTF